MTYRPRSLSATAFLALALCAMGGLASCGDDSTGPAGEGDMTVDLMNFGSTSYQMGVQGGSLVTVAPDPSTGNPTPIRVSNPGLGGSLNFVATAGGTTLNATCTVTSATGVSVTPQVVVQAGFTVLDCVDW